MKPQYKELFVAAGAAFLSFPVYEYSALLSGLLIGGAIVTLVKSSFRLAGRKSV